VKALASRKKGHQSWRVEDLKTGTPLSEALPEVWHGRNTNDGFKAARGTSRGKLLNYL